MLGVLVLLLVSAHGHATHFYTPTLSELVSGSDLVFVGEVDKVGRTLLGYRRATLRVLAPVKGDASNELVLKYGESWFQSQTNVPILMEKERYLFFAVEVDYEFLLAGITGPSYYRIERNGEVLCGEKRLLLSECTEKIRKLASTNPD